MSTLDVCIVLEKEQKDREINEEKEVSSSSSRLSLFFRSLTFLDEIDSDVTEVECYM